MEELSIKEKAQRYDEAIERVVNIRTGKCETTFIFTEGLFNYLFPELEECNEEEVRKAMIDFFKHEREEGVVVSHYGVNIERMIAWLEKQDGQKPQGKSALEAIKEEKVDNANKVEPKDYNSIDPHVGKPIDKVEPKFEVGDWITNGAEKPSQISSIEDDMYYTHNGTIGGDIESMDKEYHLWTIQDAKEGDVLVNDHHILILKELDYDRNGTPSSVKVYCDIDPNGNFEIGKDGWGFCVTLHIHPATNEQWDTLFAKMKEAGYEWDAEKKELKKTSQRMVSAEAKEAMYGKPTAWSEEDIMRIDNLIAIIENRGYPDYVEYLEKLKCRVQSKQDWNEEDENEVAILEAYIRSGEWSESHIDRALGIVDELVNKVKSLRPQKQWKPSDEQMADLWNMLCECRPADHQLLQDIYYGLKKLREE